MSLYSPEKKAEIAVEIWPFLRNGNLDTGYSFSFREDEIGEPTNPAIVRYVDGEIVSPEFWDGDTQVRDDGVLAYRPGYIPGSVAPNMAALNKYFQQAGEIQTATERYAERRKNKALATKILFGFIGVVIAILAFIAIKKGT